MSADEVFALIFFVVVWIALLSFVEWLRQYWERSDREAIRRAHRDFNGFSGRDKSTREGDHDPLA